MPEPDVRTLFALFREIGIIEQLARARLEARLPEGLIAPHYAVLSHLNVRGDGAVPIDMARAFQVPKTSMTHTLKGLEKGGYIEIRPNPADGRSKTVWMTEKGKALFEQTLTTLAPDMMMLIEQLDADKLIGILPVLTDLRTVMDAARDP
ncbi:MarR family winged helix-turn-helix transcriptional regulator [Sulfitobacter sp. JB4-11]|uniref:MarR family winged helix-turn-helix transcriptional regulator n=1 Tax=Sulfitobacter rhodophyticola TaxID=3238304 RepID=UPI003513D093